MKIRSELAKVLQHEDINFLLTNRIPRRLVTRFIGWFSKIENPLVRDCSIACWRLFSDLDLSEAKTTEFKSLHDCFTRELRDGLRRDGSTVPLAVDDLAGKSALHDGDREPALENGIRPRAHRTAR